MTAARDNASPAHEHEPVMLMETLELLQPSSGSVLLDGTLGLGGHSAAWLEASSPGGRLIAFDRDRSALQRARKRLAPFEDRVELHHEDYRDCAEILGDRRVDAALLDLGLGSHQLEDPERGFSFRYDGPLDMRFDRDRPGPSAAEILAQSSAPEIARILSEYGEERAAKRIARVIVEERRHSPIRTTFQLAELVRRIVPASHRTKSRIDPATRTFQALRIATNEELHGLQDAITTLVDHLRPGGRIVVISFHSLEDRVAKHTLRALAASRRAPDDPFAPDLPGPVVLEERKARKASPDEIARNARALGPPPLGGAPMSLPSGVVRRPPVLSPNPAAFGGLMRLALRLFLVMLPFLVLVAVQVSGTNWGYEAQRKRAEIAREKRAQQLLRAELAALRSPDRLREEADRLGLMPAPLSNPPRSLVRLKVPEDSP